MCCHQVYMRESEGNTNHITMPMMPPTKVLTIRVTSPKVVSPRNRERVSWPIILSGLNYLDLTMHVCELTQPTQIYFLGIVMSQCEVNMINTRTVCEFRGRLEE